MVEVVWRRGAGKQGAQLRSGPGLDTAKVGLVPKGARVCVAESVTLPESAKVRCRLTHPTAGWCSEKLLGAPLAPPTPPPPPLPADAAAIAALFPSVPRERRVETEKAVDDALAGLAASSSDVGHQVPQMRHALTLLGQQLASLQSAKADRARTEKELRKKVDREEIDRIAAQLAGGKDDELDPTLMAKRQVPAMKCLSCDRPLRLGLRTEAGIFPPQAYEGAAPPTTQIESLGRGPSSLDALYASGARPRSAQMPLLRPPPGTSQNLRARWPPLNGGRQR